MLKNRIFREKKGNTLAKANKNPYSKEILKQSYRKDMPKRYIIRLTRDTIYVDNSIRSSLDDYSKLLILLWDRENSFLPAHKLAELKIYIEKFKIKKLSKIHTQVSGGIPA